MKKVNRKPEENWLTTQKMADAISCHANLIYSAIKLDPNFPKIKFREDEYRFIESDVKEYIKNNPNWGRKVE